MKKPNFLIFMTDHQRGDTVLPEHPAVTPNLNKLIESGVIFTNTFCPSPHCCPARATFYSGLYPSRHGVWNNVSNKQALSTGLKDGVRLWSEDLAEAGYDLNYAGKWHVSGETAPRDHGWNELTPQELKSRNLEQDWEGYYQTMPVSGRERGDGQIIRPGYPTYTLYRASEEKVTHDIETVDRSVEFLENLQNRTSSAPWVLSVNPTAPHDPYFVPQKYLDMYNIEDIKLPDNYMDEMRDKPYIYQRMRDKVFGQLSEYEVREGIRHFWAFCTFLDEQFGRLIDALDKSGDADNTVVLYTADHGDYVGEHGLFCKGIPCFKGAYHVPAVVRWPAGMQNPGRRIDEFVSLADFAPTFLDLAGVSPRINYTGASLLPFIEDKPVGDWREEIFTQCDGVELYFTQRSVSTKDYKLVFNAVDRDELYDLKNDTGETVNLADNPDYNDILKDMYKRLWKFAQKEQDSAICKYITVAIAEYGPGIALEEDE